MENCLFFRIAGVFLQGIVDDRKILLILVFLMKENGFDACIDNCIDVVIGKNGFAVDNHLIPFDRHHFARIFIDEIFDP